MLTVTIFAAVAGIATITLALIFNLAIPGSSAGESPYAFIAGGVLAAILLFLFYRRQTGRWPGTGDFANPTTMTTEVPEDREPEKQDQQKD
jgi:hypothetical protein